MQNIYTELQRELLWDKRTEGALCWFGKDQDKRHSFNDMAEWRDSGILQDRTTYARGALNSIQFDRAAQELVTASRVPDCIQCPVEMVIGLCKHDFHESMPDQGQVDTWEIARLFQISVQARVQPDLTKSCFEHGWDAVRCFMGAKGQVITVTRGTCTIKVKCVRGGWVCRLLRG